MRRLLIMIALMLGVSLLGCSGQSARIDAPQSQDSENQSEVAEASQSSAGGGDAAQVTAKKQRDGFDMATTTPIEIAGVQFALPEYCTELSSEKNEKGSDVALYHLEGTSESAALLIALNTDGDFTEKQYEAKKNELDEYISGQFVDKFEIVSREEISVAGLKARKVTSRASSGDLGIDQIWVIFFNGNGPSLGAIGLFESDGTEYAYGGDFEKVIASAIAVDDFGDTAEEAGDSGNNEVSPDLKEMLDSYEAFIDEYVEFMADYQNSSDTLSMLQKYTEYMQKYSDLAQKIEQVDTSDMSAADYAYYIEVTARVSEKLLKVSYSL